METQIPLPVACLAPPLTDATLAAYRQIIDEMPDSRGDARDAMRACLACCEAWWDLPESQRTDGPTFKLLHRGQPAILKVVPLTDGLMSALHDVIPWPYELAAMQKLFDALPGRRPDDKKVRNAAFHLLWYAKELCLDREPITQDKL